MNIYINKGHSESMNLCFSSTNLFLGYHRPPRRATHKRKRTILQVAASLCLCLSVSVCFGIGVGYVCMFVCVCIYIYILLSTAGVSLFSLTNLHTHSLLFYFMLFLFLLYDLSFHTNLPTKSLFFLSPFDTVHLSLCMYIKLYI